MFGALASDSQSFVIFLFSLSGLLCTNPALMMDVEVSPEYVDLCKYIVVFHSGLDLFRIKNDVIYCSLAF